jgi:hypothetical protein
MLPGSAPPPSNVPRVLAAIALLSVGALAALLLSPRNGTEMRTLARKQVDGLRKRARDFAASHELGVGRANGRASQSDSPSRRPEATS